MGSSTVIRYIRRSLTCTSTQNKQLISHVNTMMTGVGTNSVPYKQLLSRQPANLLYAQLQNSPTEWIQIDWPPNVVQIEHFSMTNSTEHQLPHAGVTALSNITAMRVSQRLEESIHIMALDSRFFRQVDRIMPQIRMSVQFSCCCVKYDKKSSLCEQVNCRIETTDTIDMDFGLHCITYSNIQAYNARQCRKNFI